MRGGQAAIEGCSLLHGREQDRRADSGGEECRELGEAIGGEDEEGDQGDRRGRHGKAGGRQPEGERDYRQRGGSEGLDKEGAGRARGGEDEGQRDGGEGAEPARVVQGICEAAVDLDPWQVLLRQSLWKPGGLEPREDGDGADRSHAGGDARKDESPATPALRSEREREDAEVGRDASELGRCALGGLRPAEGKRVPDRECCKEPEHRPAGGRSTGDGQRADERAHEDNPPDSDADLASLDLVVAAVREGEVEDEDGRDQPGDESARVQPQLDGPAEANACARALARLASIAYLYASREQKADIGVSFSIS